jgi:hypothetical protein
MSYVLIVAVLAVLLLMGVLGYIAYRAIKAPMRQAAAMEGRRAEVEASAEQGVWAGATVITVNKPPKGHYRPLKVRVDLRLEVTPPDGNPYTAKTTWMVEEDVLHSIQPGSQLSVKIDQDDSMVIYPNMRGAEYRVV